MKIFNIPDLIHWPVAFCSPSFLGSAIAVAGTVMAGKAADKAADRAEASQAQQLALEREKLDFAKERWNEYKELYGDLEGGLIDEVEAYVPGETLQRRTSQAIADVDQAYDKNREIAERNMTRYGVDPGDGRFMSQSRDWGLERAKAEVFGINQARTQSEADDDKMFAKKVAMLQTGKDVPQQARDVMGGYSGVADAYGGQADYYNQQAQSYAQSAGRGMATAGYLVGKEMSKPATYGIQDDVLAGAYSGGAGGYDF